MTALAAGETHAQWGAETLGGMNVELYTPRADSPVGSGRALMVVLHGCTQTASVLRDHGNLESAADSMGVVMAVPDVPGGGVVAGCWDYYGSGHTQSSRHNGPVLEMVEQLLADPQLSIDADQVYVVGFSSGGGEALVLGCVAPEVFAGVGAVAAPALGTESSEIAVVSTTGEQAAATCAELAGDNAGALDTQAAFSFADASDFTVSTGYNAVNAEMFEHVYAQGLGILDEESFDMMTLPGPGPAGAGMTYADDTGIRLARLDSSAGEGHAWPSGSGDSAGGLSFVHGGGLNMSRFAAEFFATHNPRAGGWEPPTGGTGGTGGTDGTGGAAQTAGGSATATTTGTTDGMASGDVTGGMGTVTAGSTGAPGVSTGQGDGPAAGESGGSGGSGCSVSAPSPTRAMMLALLLLGLRRRRASVLGV